LHSVDLYGMLGERIMCHFSDDHRYEALTLFSYAVGVVKDLSFLIDILPAYIFPNDERAIGEWVLAGFSLGGNATWLGLRHGAHAPPPTTTYPPISEALTLSSDGLAL
jgi:hypothetical protein